MIHRIRRIWLPLHLESDYRGPILDIHQDLYSYKVTNQFIQGAAPEWFALTDGIEFETGGTHGETKDNYRILPQYRKLLKSVLEKVRSKE